MRVEQIYVYPVKSMAGQQVGHWPVSTAGLDGDRCWAVVDDAGKLGSGKDTRRFRRLDPLFTWRARLAGPGAEPAVTDGPTEALDWRSWDDPEVAGRLSDQCATPVRLARHTGDVELGFKDGGLVSLVGTATLAALGDLVDRVQGAGSGAPIDPRHLRVNLVVGTEEPYVEDGWVGSRLRFGDTEYEVTERVSRCRMVDVAQADLPAEPGLLRATGARDACAAVYLKPLGTGAVGYGDPVTVVPG